MTRQTYTKAAKSKNTRPIISRKVIGVWVMGGGIWILGMLGLFAAPVTADITASTMTTLDYYAYSGSWQTYTDPSGKYTVVIRSLVPARGI